jgi:hypothetical protein
LWLLYAAALLVGHGTVLITYARRLEGR